MKFSEERIAHLTKEIELVTANQMTFRLRMGLTVMIGPFFVMGSVLFATEGKVVMPTWDAWFIGLLIVAVLSYFGLAWYGSRLDNHMTNKCNEWRQAIIELSNSVEPGKEKCIFLQSAERSYMSGFILGLSAFLSITYCIACILPNQRETPHEAAMRICKDCGLLGPEIDELIQQVRESGLTPAQEVQLWKDTAGPEAVDLCRPCVEAVIEADQSP